METLSRLFGSRAKVKLLKLFLFNPEKFFLVEEIKKRTGVEARALSKELNSFEKIGLIRIRHKKPSPVKKSSRRSKLKTKTKRRVKEVGLNPRFSHLNPLKNLLLYNDPLTSAEIAGRLSGAGPIKLVVVSGVFLQEEDSRADLLIVGDKFNKRKLEKAVRAIESDVGRELVYALLTTSDFKYRLNIYDRLVRDILDYPHKKIINKFNFDL